LKNNKDKEPLLFEQDDTPHIPKHTNIRGASNYN
jgi:hypothetical protein